MIYNGARPTRYDHRDKSFPRTFGSIGAFTDEFNTDIGETMPDQNSVNNLFNPVIPPLPYGCTGYTTSEIASDQDNILYNPRFTYDKTLFMEGGKDGDGCDIRNSLKSAIIYGLQAQNEPPEKAMTHRRGQYFNVIDVTDYDAFDDIRSAVRYGKRSVSLGLPWLPEYNDVGTDGIMPHVPLEKYAYKGWFGLGPYVVNNDARVTWHNVKVSGWITKNGKPYLKMKSWQGSGYGDKGWCYADRETFNDLEKVNGVAAFTVAPFSQDNAENVKSTARQFILSYLRNRVGLPI